MKRKRGAEAQSVFALQQAEGGALLAEICLRVAVAEQTCYPWMRRYGALVVSEIRRLCQLEEKCPRLK